MPAPSGRTERWAGDVSLLSVLDRIRDRIVGAPEGASPRQLARALQRGSSSLRIRTVRAAGAAGHDQADPVFRELLTDPVPGVRRAAAWALGRLASPSASSVLLRAARDERCDAPRLAMAVASVRCGAAPGEAWQVVDKAARRELSTFYGPRAPTAVGGMGTAEALRLWRRTLDPGAGEVAPDAVRRIPSDEIREWCRQVMAAEPERRDLLETLGAQQHPDDFALLMGRLERTGRRERHALSRALGLHGDPRSAGVLTKVLSAIDVDPGHGFAGRRAAAEALGRLGDPGAAPALVRAMEAEAIEHEGRPGAGLGIQFPVRMVMIAALGEAGAVSESRRLAGYLANTHGSAMGGFYLPAMDALWKLGQTEPLLELLSQPALPAANALGVLGALGRLDVVAHHLEDARPRVAAAAAQAQALAG